MKLLLFDIDGTLLLTGGAGKVAFERVFEELFDIKDAWKNLHPDGKIDPAIIAELGHKNFGRDLSKDEYQKIYEKYHLYFEEELPRSERFRLMPGVTNLLGLLSKCKDVLLGIATGNFEGTAKLKLKQAKLDHHFKFGGFADRARDRVHMTEQAIRKGHEQASCEVAHENVFVIGDSIHDIDAAKAHGVKSIAVLTGSTPKEDLESKGPHAIFEDLSNAESFLQALD